MELIFPRWMEYVRGRYDMNLRLIGGGGGESGYWLQKGCLRPFEMLVLCMTAINLYPFIKRAPEVQHLEKGNVN